MCDGQVLHEKNVKTIENSNNDSEKIVYDNKQSEWRSNSFLM